MDKYDKIQKRLYTQLFAKSLEDDLLSLVKDISDKYAELIKCTDSIEGDMYEPDYSDNKRYPKIKEVFFDGVEGSKWVSYETLIRCFRDGEYRLFSIGQSYCIDFGKYEALKRFIADVEDFRNNTMPKAAGILDPIQNEYVS